MEAEALRRDVMRLSQVNEPMYNLRMGLMQGDLAKVQRNGPLFEKQLQQFEATHNQTLPVAQNFLRDARALLAEYGAKVGALQRQDMVKKEMIRLRSQGSWFKAEAALAQRDAKAVATHGNAFRQELQHFMAQYEGEPTAKSFIEEAKKLLSRIDAEGGSILRSTRVKDAIQQIRERKDMIHLTMALTMRDSDKVKLHGEAFKAQFESFKAQFGSEPAAHAFMSEAQALMTQYERESPSIIREGEIKQAINNLRTKSELTAMQNAVHSHNLDVLRAKGPTFESQMNQFLAQYNTDPAYSTIIPPTILEQLSDVATRYYSLMNIPKTFNPRPPKPAAAVSHSAIPSGMFRITTTAADGTRETHDVAPKRIDPTSFLTGGMPHSLVSLLNTSLPTGFVDSSVAAAELGKPPSSMSGGPFSPFAGASALPTGFPTATARMMSSGPTSPLFSFEDHPTMRSWVTVVEQPSPSSSQGYANTSPTSSQGYTNTSSPSSSSPSSSSSSSSLSSVKTSSGYTDSASPKTSPASGYTSTMTSPAANVIISRTSGYVADSQPGGGAASSSGPRSQPACPINPAYAPSSPSVAPKSAPAPNVRTSTGGLTEQEKLTVEEAKAKMKFREITFHELQILDKVGSGQLGTVYRALWRGSLVAVKRLEEDMDDTMVNLFKQEAAALHVLSHHPSLATFVGACCEAPNVCIVTQFYRYGSLEGALRGKTRLEFTWKQVVKVALEVAAGILHLHQEGVLHSRISSRNILLGDGLRAYVNDFAFCHLKPKEQVYTHTAGTSSFIGPVRYMSPEAMMHKYSEGSDAWSFGVLLWELWERREPFEGEDDLTVAFRVSQDSQTLPIAASCPLVLANLMKQCWLDRPSQRPSFTTIYETLESYYRQLE